jgi:hypothetical protein
MEEARIKMVEDPSWANESVFSALFRMLREGTFFASFSTLPAMLAKQVRSSFFNSFYHSLSSCTS